MHDRSSIVSKKKVSAIKLLILVSLEVNPFGPVHRRVYGGVPPVRLISILPDESPKQNGMVIVESKFKLEFWEIIKSVVSSHKLSLMINW